MSDQIIEFFLFIDPLGKQCNSVRKIIKDFRVERAEDIKLRIIPMINSRRVYGRTRKKCDSTHKSFVDLNNQFSSNTYQASLAFYAAAMQGKNKAHQFLAVLQEAVVEKGVDFSEELVDEIIDEIGLDREMFEEDYRSDLAKRFYHKNLKLASEMNVMSTPTCVIFKNNAKEKAVRLDQKIETKLLHSVCGWKDMLVLDQNQKTEVDEEEQIVENNVQNILRLKAL